jgi:hypothetical protein
MCFLSAYFLWNAPKSDNNRYFYIAYSGTLLVLITIAMSCNLWFGQSMWIGTSQVLLNIRCLNRHKS